jgi:acetoin utilization deacetylase AcuC-like enzyme
MPVLIVTAPDVAMHDPLYEINLGRHVTPVWESPQRHAVLHAAMVDAGFDTTPATSHGEGIWRDVHDPELVDWLRDGYAAWRAAGGPEVLIPDAFAHRALHGRRPPSPIGAAGWWLMDTATPIVAGSWQAATAAVDAALTAVDLVVDGGHTVVHALTRPPGHHAGRAYLGGFCLVNHAAIAATALRRQVGRVTVLDIDHHHGNGTQELFLTDGQIQYVSLHADPVSAYPWFAGFADEVGDGPGRGATLNLPLPMGTDDDSYIATLQRAADAIDAHDPAVIVLSLGTDTADGDPVGGLGLSTDAYARIGAAVAALGRPVVSVHEGGYDLARIGGDSVNVLRGLSRLTNTPGSQDVRG